MSRSQQRAAPDLEGEAPDRLPGTRRATLRGALRDKYGDGLDVDGARGPRAAWLAAAVPDGRRTHEVVVFARDDDAGAAFDRCVDYLDGVLAELEEGAFLPLDFEGRPFDDAIIFVRGELRDYAAEEEAAKLLHEAPPPRLVRSGVQ